MSEGDVVSAITNPVEKVTDPMVALQKVLKEALACRGVARGLHEVVRDLDTRAARLCVLAENCDEPNYVRLVKGLCAEHDIPLITVEDSKLLGEWAGLCKLDKEATARKVVACSCVAIKTFGKESEEYKFLMEYVEKNRV
ncbi:40S ribosomal protein S12 [Heterostelium album PN500]|uniref:40S ribosomal protein S12 n=1 Tax=Heterostelium pallidum (strain ATCC 26659 / Pp 5 / PN500) TaxID=670386 RepID=D3BD80_HETP5|nr:40S ribosomal protein S12 [Heterostelium album PN500]EFA80872.1 40S ribosomal protein S12 [Heterostelium album PN500]|eukprot:XP_020432991.1 40S ribosomal protein S12 [Heterostelium album PN500]